MTEIHIKELNVKLDEGQVLALLNVVRQVAWGQQYKVSKQAGLYACRLSWRSGLEMARATLTSMNIGWAMQPPHNATVKALKRDLVRGYRDGELY